MAKTLVAYFSVSGRTAHLAKQIAGIIEGDIYEIVAHIPYTKADLNWLNSKSRSSIEMADKSSRPAINRSDLAIQQYDTIFLGFPIWWYIAPTIINTFLESYDFSNRKIILFATSGSSGFGDTVKFLTPSVSENATIIEGFVLHRKVSDDKLKQLLVQIIH